MVPGDSRQRQKAKGGAKAFRAVPGWNRSARCFPSRQIYELSVGHIGTSAPSTLAELGISKKVASVAQQLAALPQGMRDAIAAKEITIGAARREQNANEIRRTVSLPNAKYRVCMQTRRGAIAQREQTLAEDETLRLQTLHAPCRLTELLRQLSDQLIVLIQSVHVASAGFRGDGDEHF